jgi:hypothetical protein
MKFQRGQVVQVVAAVEPMALSRLVGKVGVVLKVWDDGTFVFPYTIRIPGFPVDVMLRESEIGPPDNRCAEFIGDMERFAKVAVQ